MCMCACGRVHSLCEHKIHHTLAVALTVTHSLCDERTRTHEVYRCTVHSRHQDRAARTRSCWPRGAVPCAACPVCVSASSRSRSTVRESGSGHRCHGSDGVLPSGRDRREAGGGAAAAADAPAAQSCRAGERWHTARRRRRRPPRWLSLLSRRRFASRRRQLLRRESSEATYAPPLCGSSKERTRWQSWLQAKERVSRKRIHGGARESGRGSLVYLYICRRSRGPRVRTGRGGRGERSRH